jgi:hypothetical protein
LQSAFFAAIFTGIEPNRALLGTLESQAKELHWKRFVDMRTN